MRCPECKSLNEAGSAACRTCGLILLNTKPKRRAGDWLGLSRRSSDVEMTACRFCTGEIPATAIRCRHCSEVVNDDYYRERSLQIRSRINYASWVAYLFGLGALLVFRPVGILSIAAGLLLSILYYAIPVEPPESSKKKRRISFATFFRHRRMDRVSIPIPALRNKKLVFVGTPLVAALIGYSANLFLLQEPMNEVLSGSASFQGMEVSTHYQYWVVPGVVVYDLRALSFRQTPIDVHTALLEFAKRVRDKRYTRIDLSYRGQAKFSIDGASFQRLGHEYARRNFDYVLYALPRLLRNAKGQTIEPTGSDREALLEFHRRWYGEDPLTRTAANRL